MLPGCYGRWSRYRDCGFETVKQLIDEGKPYVLRLRSPGKEGGRITLPMLSRASWKWTKTMLTRCFLKSDGIPTYHFAHAVDDHLMRVTHVVRGEEWLSSLPLHLQLFRVLNFKAPKYLHISLLMKQDGGSKRKLSKRHDPEAALTYYRQQGYPVRAVREYVMTLLNSNYEEWRMQNPALPLEDFKFTTAKMAHSGSLFRPAKAGRRIKKNTIAAMSAAEVTKQVLDWSRDFDPKLHALLSADRARTEKNL